MDTTLLLPSAIGSPAAFSTAIKPPGNFSAQPSSGDTSLLVQQPHNRSDNVAGQLSLSLVSEPLHTEGPASNDTSLGILDLDNIQESSMSVFLTSPRTSQDLHNLVTAHPELPTHPTPHPPPSSLSAVSHLPSMDLLRLSENTAPTSSSQLVDNTATYGGEEREGEEEREELSLPEDLLEVSSSVGYSSTGESEPEELTGGENQLIRTSPTAGQSGADVIPSVVPADSIPDRSSVPAVSIPNHPHEPTDSIPDHVRKSGDGRETNITRLLGQGLPNFPPSTPPLLTGHHSLQPQRERGSSEGFSVAEILSNAERKGKELGNSNLFSGTATGDSLITDQEEPTIMREAAEFSQFEPDHLASVMNRDSLLRESRMLEHGSSTSGDPASTAAAREGENSGGNQQEEEGKVVDGEQQMSMLSTEATSPEGLPSAYFQPSSVLSSPSHTPTHTLSHTPSDTPNSSPLFSPSSSVPPERDGGGEGEGKKQMESGVKQHRTSYNPFDSEGSPSRHSSDAGSVQEMGDEEFRRGLDSGSFMAHLEADEEAVQEANKLMLPASFTAATPHTPSFAQLSSTSLPASLTHSGEKELSIGAYFGQRSYKLGVLQTSGVPPSDRPHFSASSSRLLNSPLSPPKSGSTVLPDTTPTSQASSTPPDVADTTLVATGDESFVEKTPGSTRGALLEHSAHSLTAEPQQTAGTTGSTQSLSLPTSSAAKLVSPPSTSGAKVVSKAAQAVTTAPALLSTQTQVHVTGTSSPSAVTTNNVPTGVSYSKLQQSIHVSGGVVTQITAPVTRVSVESLTPVVTVHTPFPMQYEIPKLDFSKTMDTTPHTRSSTGLKSTLPALSAEFKYHTTPHPLTQTAPAPVPLVMAIGSSPELAPTTTTVVSSGSSPPDMECGLQQSGMDSGLSSGIEPRLASQYWKHSSASSTLIFPELSATTLSPPPTYIGGLSCMPTPSLAHLSGGFNATSEDGSFLESLLESLPTTSPHLPSHTSKLHTTSPSTSTVVTTAPAVPTTQPPRSQPLGPSSSVRTVLTTDSSETKTVTSSPLQLASQVSSQSLPPPVATQPPASTVASGPLPTVTTAATLHSPQSGSPGTTKTPRKQRPLSPRTQTAKKKMANLRATLDATQFDAAAYLASLEERRTVVSQSPTVVSQRSTVVSRAAIESVTVVCQSTPVATQSTTVVSTGTVQSTTVVSQSPPVDLQNATLVQPVSLSFSTASPTTATLTPGSGVLQDLSPSPPQSLPPSTSSQPPAVTRPSQTSGAGKLQPQATSHSLEQIDSGTQCKKKKKKATITSVAELPENGEQSHTHQFVAVRDVGVGTTPGLRKLQTRFSTHVTEEVAVSSTTQPESSLPTVSPSVSPQKSTPSFLKSPLSPTFSPSVAASSRQEQVSSQPIYTSPRLHPSTSSLSPPSQPHSQPLTYRERRKTPEANTLKVPDSLIFKSTCCVGVTLPDQLLITNVGDRWLQLGFELSQLYCNGMPCQTSESTAFSFPKRCFVSPRKTESIKITFSPKQVGSFEAVLTCKAKLVMSSEKDNSNYISESIILKALSVSPKLRVSTSRTESETCLDYGVLVSGSSLSLPLLIANHSPCELPLRLAIAAPTLSQLYFSFEDVPPSLKTHPSSPSSYLHTRPFSTLLTLPSKPQGSSKKPEIYSVNVNFKSPRNYADDATPLGPPEEITAQVNISVEGPNSTGVLCSVPIRAVVGVARLHVPRSLQALSLSCAEKHSATRDVPFKNAGNIPLQIALKFSTDCDHFLVTPNSLELSPTQEAQVKVSFSPPTSPLVVDGYLMIHVQPDGPSYELKIRGTAETEEELQGNGTRGENLLFCNKRHLYWGGVNLGDTVEQKLLLQNSFSSAVPLQFSVRHKNQAFQLHTDTPSVCWEHSADIPANNQLQLDLLFTPVSKSVFRNALDIFDSAHSKKFRISLCGYGGTSAVEVVNARHSSSQEPWLDLGPVSTQQQSKVNVSLYNSGVRAAFVKALCLPLDSGDSVLPVPPSQACVTPSECVLQPQQMQDLSIVYRPRSSQEVAKCAETVTALAQLVVLHGDEIIRQRFQRAMAASETEEREGESTERPQLSKRLNADFLQQFPGQDSVPSELDFALFEVEDEERFFEQHVQQITVTLSGSPLTETPIPAQSNQPLSSSFDSPPKALHTLSPSHSISLTTPPGHTHVATPSSRIISSHTLALPDSAVGQRSEKMLEIRNPYSQPLHWQLSSVASPFVRNSVNTTSDICKANYSAFWVHEKRGTVLPHSTSQVLVEFQPHDIGSFSQIWDLQVSCKDIANGSKKFKLSFGGKAIVEEQVKVSDDPTPGDVPRVRFAHHPPQPPSPISHPTHPHTTVATAHPHTLTKRTVYIKEEMVEFPPTKVGGQSILKVKVCNRDRFQHQFQVVSLSPPFSVLHHSFELGSRQCARLPVHFSPSRPGVFEAVLAVRTASGHQAFSQLTGQAIPFTDNTT